MNASHSPAPRAWQTVLEKIEGDLLEGRLAPGDRLPGERDLSASLGVGRSSVREALRVLEVMGLIRTATGSGPNAGAIIIATPSGGMSALLRLQVAAKGFPIDDVMATRLVLESAVVVSLADADDRPLDDVYALLEAMDADDLAPDEFLALDAQLHLALADASGNVVIAAMMAGLRSAIEAYVQSGIERFDDWDAEAARLRQEHRRVLAAIQTGHAERAAALLREHITGYYAQAGLSPAGA